MGKPTRAETLTSKQEKFVLNIVNGMSQRQAYINAFDRKCVNETQEKSIDTDASVMFNTPKVYKRYLELLEEQKDRFILSAVEKRKLLKSIIVDESEKKDTRLKALDIDNKMAGEYIDRHEFTNDVKVIYNRINDND